VTHRQLGAFAQFGGAGIDSCMTTRLRSGSLRIEAIIEQVDSWWHATMPASPAVS
jgi:hypothetical protein